MDKNDNIKDKKDSAKSNIDQNEIKQKLEENKEAKKNEVELLKTRVEECENKYKRALADYQNLEKRVSEERHEWIATASKQLILNLLPILDTLILTKKHISVQDEGLSLSLKQFLDTLKTEGVKKIEVLNKKFDPKLMQCIQTVEGEEDKVLEEVRPGYTLYGNILRVALVKVGKVSVK